MVRGLCLLVFVSFVGTRKNFETGPKRSQNWWEKEGVLMCAQGVGEEDNMAVCPDDAVEVREQTS